jgi:hypothetical protein
MAKTNVATAEEAIGNFAEDLGKMLGQARSKAEGWLGQRKAIVKNLTDLRDEATKLLTQLGHDAVTVTRRGRPAGSKNVAKAGQRKKRKMSAKARKAISQAQKVRWAKQKAGAKE